MHIEVRRLREARGLSQGELAVKLAVSRQTVNSIETGRYPRASVSAGSAQKECRESFAAPRP